VRLARSRGGTPPLLPPPFTVLLPVRPAPKEPRLWTRRSRTLAGCRGCRYLPRPARALGGRPKAAGPSDLKSWLAAPRLGQGACLQRLCRLVAVQVHGEAALPAGSTARAALCCL